MSPTLRSPARVAVVSTLAALAFTSCLARKYNAGSKNNQVEYTSYDSQFIGMDWRTAEDDPNSTVPAQRAAPNVLVEAINKAWTMANGLLNVEFVMIVTGHSLSDSNLNTLSSETNSHIRLLNLHLVHSSSIRISADGSVSFLKPKSEQQTDKAALDLSFQTVGDSKSVDMVAYFDFRDKATGQWYRSNFAIKEPLEFWNMGISTKAGSEISPSSIATAILKAPAPVARALSSIVDQLGSVNFHVSFAGQRQWLVQESMKRRLKDNDGGETDITELAYTIARDIMQPVCRESLKRGNPQIKSANDCELKYTRNGVLASPSEQVQEFRTMKIVNCRVTEESRNFQKLSYLYALAPAAEMGKPDFLIGSKEIKTYLFESEKGTARPWRRKQWLTLVSPQLQASDAKRFCGELPEGKRCIVAELGEGGGDVGKTCGTVHDTSATNELVLSLSDKDSMPREQAPLFPTN